MTLVIYQMPWNWEGKARAVHQKNECTRHCFLTLGREAPWPWEKVRYTSNMASPCTLWASGRSFWRFSVESQALLLHGASATCGTRSFSFSFWPCLWASPWLMLGQTRMEWAAQVIFGNLSASCSMTQGHSVSLKPACLWLRNKWRLWETNVLTLGWCHLHFMNCQQPVSLTGGHHIPQWALSPPWKRKEVSFHILIVTSRKCICTVKTTPWSQGDLIYPVANYFKIK